MVLEGGSAGHDSAGLFAREGWGWPGHHLGRVARQETQFHTPSKPVAVQLMKQDSQERYLYKKQGARLT